MRKSIYSDYGYGFFIPFMALLFFLDFLVSPVSMVES